MLYDPHAHEALAAAAWDPGRVRDAIGAIAMDAEHAFDEKTLWALHPADAEVEAGPHHGIYLGAAGVVWALERLARSGFWEPARDWPAEAASLHQRYLAKPDLGEVAPSLFLGESGILLVSWLLSPSNATADLLAEQVRRNAGNETNELLWGSPGTMLAARVMWQRTQEERWRALWLESAERLWSEWGADEEDLWTQRLYGQVRRFLGPAHGFAGNVLALAQGRALMSGADAFERRAIAVLRRTAVVEDGLANWPPVAGGGLASSDGSIRVQWCHGAPGMVTSLGGLAPRDAEHEALLVAGGELTWVAGPLVKGASLCHGTAGNGFAFLKLFLRTGDERWLERARAFAMHAIRQVETARARYGRGRFTLWTGDLGTALYLEQCLEGTAEIPTIDVW